LFPVVPTEMYPVLTTGTVVSTVNSPVLEYALVLYNLSNDLTLRKYLVPFVSVPGDRLVTVPVH
jgi:hypothetical protein